MNKKVLVIDDLRVFINEEGMDVTYLRDTDDFRMMYPNEWVTEPHWDECWLDNDMGLLSKGGDVSVLVNELEEMAAEGDKFPIDVFIIHTANSVEASKMYQALLKWYPVRIVKANDFMIVP